MLWALGVPSDLFLLSETKPGDPQRHHHQGLIISCWGHRSGPWRSLPPASPPPPPCRGVSVSITLLRKAIKSHTAWAQHADPAGLTLMSPCHFSSSIRLTTSQVHSLECTLLSLPPCLSLAHMLLPVLGTPRSFFCTCWFFTMLVSFLSFWRHPDLQVEVRDPLRSHYTLQGPQNSSTSVWSPMFLSACLLGCSSLWGQRHGLVQFCSLNTQHSIWHTVGAQ